VVPEGVRGPIAARPVRDVQVSAWRSRTSALYEEGSVVKGWVLGWPGGWWSGWWRSSLYRLLGGRIRSGRRLTAGQSQLRAVMRPERARGALPERTVPGGGEHVPDGLSEPAGDLDTGNRGAALPAEPPLGGLVVVVVDGMAGGVDRSLDQRPPQVLRPVLAQRPAMIAAAGLGDPGAQPRVANQLLGGGEPGDLPDLCGDGVPQHPGDAGGPSSAGAHRGGRRPADASRAHSRRSAPPGRR